MKLHHFKALSEDKKYRNLLLNGECIATRETEEHCILLFQLSDFYVEIYFDSDCDEIIRCRTFQDTNELSPYLEQINITDLT